MTAKKAAAAKGAVTKKKRKKKSILHSTFYRVYFAVVILCVVGILIGARWLNGLLVDYESAQPKYVAQTAAKLFEDGDYETIYSYDTSAPNLAGGDKDYYLENMRTLASGKDVSWSESYSSNNDEKHYTVNLAGEKFAEMTLVPSGETTAHGNRFWKLGSITTYVAMGEQEPVPEEEEPAPEETPVPAGIPCKITVPSDFVVTVDGRTLTEDDVTTAGIPTASDGLLPKGVASPTLTEYGFYSESGEPQIAVTNAKGAAQEVASAGEYSWSCALEQDTALKKKFQKPIVEIAKRLASCAAKTITKEGILKYCVKDSPAYQKIAAFDNSTGYSKKPEKFEKIKTSQYYRYSKNCFSCHVSFNYISKFTAKVIKTYPTTYTLYFVYEGNSGRLYNFTYY